MRKNENNLSHNLLNQAGLSKHFSVFFKNAGQKLYLSTAVADPKYNDHGIYDLPPEDKPPILSITAPHDGTTIKTDTPTIIVAFGDLQSGILKKSLIARLNGIDIAHLFTVAENSAVYVVSADNPLTSDNYTLYVSIEDRAGNQSEAISHFELKLLRATPKATPVSGAVPLTVHFTSRGVDPDGTIEKFRWDFNDDGAFDTYDEMARDYNYTYNDPGIYNATLRVWSSTGKTAQKSVAISVQNNPPTAVAHIAPSNGQIPLTAQFFGTGHDPDGKIVLFEWDFDGDGTFDFSSPTTGVTAHTYTRQGNYQAVFRVTDNNGQTATALPATTALTVGPQGSPTAMAAANIASGKAPLSVNFTAAATSETSPIVLYEWDYDGDGIYDWFSKVSKNTSNTYTKAGTHLARLRVTSQNGLTSIDQVPITVRLTPRLFVERDTIGIFAQGVSASASSISREEYSPDNVLNGSGNCWYSKKGDSIGAWFEIKFYQVQTIFGLRVNWCDKEAYKITRGRIDVYNESETLIYSKVHHFSDVSSFIPLPAIPYAARVRLTAVATTGQPYLAIAKFLIDANPLPDAQPMVVGTYVNTAISADAPVTVLIMDRNENIVRTLVNNQMRSMGSYRDYWDCRDDYGAVVSDGTYFAVMQYIVDGKVVNYNLTDSTGGKRYHPPHHYAGKSTCQPRAFKPFEDDFLPINFFLDKASEVTIFIGALNTEDAIVKTVINRMPLPAGKNTILWDGTDDKGNLALPPPGDHLIIGIWGYHLPQNAMIMTGGKPVISAVSADPNYYSPFSEKCDVSGSGEGVLLDYTLSEDAANVELRVYSQETDALLRTASQTNISAGKNTFFWDGKNNKGEYVDIGDYQIGLIATDRHGNESMLKYALIRIEY